jgi:hypothetical protein
MRDEVLPLLGGDRELVALIALAGRGPGHDMTERGGRRSPPRR